jgi:G:T-mismatch repair DNA endonuclease (very short patch repair protein)
MNLARKLERERDEAREEAETIKEAAWAVVHRWETPLWKDAPATAELINKLRKKLTHNTNFQPT